MSPAEAERRCRAAVRSRPLSPVGPEYLSLRVPRVVGIIRPCAHARIVRDIRASMREKRGSAIFASATTLDDWNR